MAATLEVNYFSTFWLKKINSIVEVKDTTGAADASTGTTITLKASNINVGAGQIVTNQTTPWVGNPTVTVLSVAANNQTITIDLAQTVNNNDVLVFTGRADDTYIPEAFEAVDANDWYIEEARIRGGYNNTSVDFGVKAYIVEDTFKQQHRISSLIYSGIFNSRTGVNNTNQFSVGQDITRSADPANGSIQKLYAEDTNLIIFQEDKVSRALIDKDAIYSAEGGGSVTSSSLVIGQIVAYAGEYGISTNPKSFAVYGYRKYFTDRRRGCVLRLTTGGEIVEISGYGMHDFFRDQLTQDGITRIVGGWDNHTKNYILSIQTASGYKTTSFDEGVQGWTSFFSFKPSFMFSLTSTFFSTNAGKLYSHYGSSAYGRFYDAPNNIFPSDVTVVLNSSPSTVKVFKTVNYEGNNDWTVSSIVASSGDIALVPISKYSLPSNLTDLESEMFSNKFKRKENKYFANIINNSPATKGEILWGPSVTGIKGFFSTFKFNLDNSINQKRELFAVSSDTVESSY